MALGILGSSLIGAGIGALGSRGGGSQTTTAQFTPPGFITEGLQRVGQEATSQFEAPGSLVAPFTGAQVQGQQGQLDFAQNILPGLLNQQQGALSFLTNPALLDPSSNPHLAAAAQAAINPIFQQLTEQFLPAIRSGATATGQQGSSRQGIAEGLAGGRASQQAFDVTSKIFADAYQRGLQTLLQGTSMLPQAFAGGLLPGAIQQDVGATQQAQTQRGLDEPNLRLQRLFEFFQPRGAGGTTTQTGPPTQGSPLLGGLGGALTGASLFNLLGGGAGGGGFGGLLGGGLGASAGAF